MINNDSIRNHILELGMEDFIPIPELMAAPVVRDAAHSRDLIDAVAKALAGLLSEGRIQMFRGHWDADPSPVPTAEAPELLRDPRWYSFHTEDPNEERLYFINVANLRESVPSS